MPAGNLPLFESRDAEGHVSGTEGLWQQHEMIVAVLHGQDCDVCRAAERAFRVGEAAWIAQNVGLVFVQADDPIARTMFECVAPLGVPRGAPCVAIADRFGQLFAALEVHAMEAQDLVAQARSWIEFVQEQCEECGAPLEWE
jgi:hypothetical protein